MALELRCLNLSYKVDIGCLQLKDLTSNTMPCSWKPHHLINVKLQNEIRKDEF